MKLILRILFWLGIVVLVVAAIGFLLPSKVHVERSISIHAKQEVVYDFLSDLNNWNKWSPWYNLDTATKYIYEGPAKGMGAIMKWESKNKHVGSGSLKISEAIPNQMIKLDLDFIGEGTAITSQKIETEVSGTRVTWSFDADMGYNPLMRIMGKLFFDSAVGKDYEKGLQKMKTVIESLPPM